MGDPPGSWLNQFRPTQEPLPDPAPTTNGGGRGDWTPTAYARAALNAEVANVLSAPEGTRNDTLNKAAFNLAQLISGGQISAERVIAELTNAAAEAGLPQRDTAKTIRSGLSRGGGRARTAPERPLAGPQEPEQAEEVPEPQFVDWGALWAKPDTVDWLVEPIIPAGRLVSLYSPPGVGKSLLALQLASAIAQGGPVLGTEAQRATVLYLDYENVDIDVRDRLIDMGHAPGGLRRLLYWSFPEIQPLDTPEGGKALTEAATGHGARLVVIDTLSRCIEGDENDAATMLNMYRLTLMPLKAAGIAVLRLDHTGKDEARGQRGTSAKSGDVDLVWRYSEIAPGQFLLQNEKHRIRIPQNELTLNIRRTESPTTHEVDTRSIGQAKKDAVVEALDAAGLPADAGRERARAVLNASGIKIRDTTLADIIRERRGLLPEQ